MGPGNEGILMRSKPFWSEHPGYERAEHLSFYREVAAKLEGK